MIQLTISTTNLSNPTIHHIKTDWQLATNSDFTNIVLDNPGDTVNLVSWDIPDGVITPGDDYYARARVYTEISNTDWFEANIGVALEPNVNPIILPPVIDYKINTITRQLEISLGEYQTIYGSDSHKSTDYSIKDKNGVLVFEELDSSNYLLGITIPLLDLLNNFPLSLEVRFNGHLPGNSSNTAKVSIVRDYNYTISKPIVDNLPFSITDADLVVTSPDIALIVGGTINGSITKRCYMVNLLTYEVTAKKDLPIPSNTHMVIGGYFETSIQKPDGTWDLYEDYGVKVVGYDMDDFRGSAYVGVYYPWSIDYPDWMFGYMDSELTVINSTPSPTQSTPVVCNGDYLFSRWSNEAIAFLNPDELQVDNTGNPGPITVTKSQTFQLDPTITKPTVCDSNGRILMFGGVDPNTGAILSDVYHTPDQPWDQLASKQPMPIPLVNHKAIELSNGEILITGGMTEENSSLIVSKRCYIYNVSEDRWYRIQDMSTPRMDHFMTKLPNGSILIGGGRSYIGDNLGLSTLELMH